MYSAQFLLVFNLIFRPPFIAKSLPYSGQQLLFLVTIAITAPFTRTREKITTPVPKAMVRMTTP